MTGQAVFGPAGRELDRVCLVGLTARGFHGVLAEERRTGQDFVVDVVLHLDTRQAARDDDLAATVDYGRLATAVADVVRGPAVRLVETLADRIAAVCLAEQRVVAVDVTVHKPHAPVLEPFGDVRVELRRYRDES
ncbi:MAG: dihydroneopterin aldolase [Actinomycetales bacterium]|nr:dihydroneopterin aldolase [Actinomycetales bacterium]